MNFQNNFNAVSNTPKSNSDSKRGIVEARIEARRAWRAAYMKEYRARKKRQSDIVHDRVSAKISRERIEDSTPDKPLNKLQQKRMQLTANSQNYRTRKRNLNNAASFASIQSIETDRISEPDSYDSNDGELVLKFETSDPQLSTSQSSSDFTTTIVNRSTMESPTMRQSIMEASQTTAHNTHASNRNDLINWNLQFMKLEPGNPQPSTSQSAFDLFKEQILAIEKEKVELEREKFKMEREKFELKKEKERF
ncbi:uncharacterized protein LOC118741239 [Rhagoletis pomonella]|uniref:uncharacterized protein LOC118741239 n=1 Tax=Rhagoletis pomonella TaxID=28610 RepID=UPI00177F0B17|nr:uncharacterized protein LOC118741239 [Rhagoletis pomonella]XP_036329045.1 uncharacterized protein LOC118741239 [Rhagoletis pomonella]XP_036329046.1 uncharacterized protein LOC118741239 [Rhagoletis pomonella]